MLRLWCGLVLLSGAAGCSGPVCPAQLPRDPTQLLQGHRSARQPATSIRAEARVEQWNKDSRIRGTVRMFVQRPDRLRFDAMTQFGPAAILTSDGSQFALHDLRDNRFMQGPTCPTNIARLLGIPLSGEQAALLLLGDTPVIAALHQSVACGGDGTYVVTLTDEQSRRQEIELAIRAGDESLPPYQQRTRLVRSEVFDARGRTEWRASFADHRVVPDPKSHGRMGVALPFRIRFQHPRTKADTTVRFVDIDVNASVPPEAFQQALPPGLASERVSCD